MLAGKPETEKKNETPYLCNFNFDQAKPYYVDGETPSAKVVSIVKPTKK